MPLAAKGVLVPARDGQQVYQRIEIPQAVLYRRRGQHEDKAKSALFQGLPEAFGDLRGLFDAIEVSQLVRLIQHQHLETVLRD